jgi:hypothetical protein
MHLSDLAPLCGNSFRIPRENGDMRLNPPPMDAFSRHSFTLSAASHPLRQRLETNLFRR